MRTGPALVGHTSVCSDAIAIDRDGHANADAEEAKQEAEEAKLKAVPEERAAEPPAD